jgi:gliding motility-associated-like protein
MKSFSSLLFLLALSMGGFAQLVVDGAVTPEQAVENILIGDGVEVSNITFSGGQDQIGSFNSANSNIPLLDGVILSTGSVNVAVGPNDSGSATEGGGNFGVNDPDLDQLSTFNTNDAVILEFDFVSQGDSVKFNYTFGSEEYNEYVCGSVNDAFGFFLSGPGINGPFSDNAINLATIPDTDIPVTINTVNLGVSGSNGTPSNCAQVSPDWDQNAEFYIDNETNGDPNSTQLDGFTVTLTAAAQVECGETYHIKIAIADAGDTAFDSAVFLEGGSFSTSAAISASVPDAPPSLPPLTMLEGCVDGIFTVFRPNAEEQDTLFLEIGGTATDLDDYLGIPDFVVFPDGELTFDIPVSALPDDLEEGLEFITLTYDYTNACGEQDTIVAQLNIQDYIEPTLDLPEDVFLCNGESTSLNATPNDGFAPFFYTWSTGGNGPVESISPDDGDSVFVSVEDFCGSVIGDSLAILIPDPFVPADSTELCIGGSTPILATGGALPYTVEVVEYDGDGNPVTIDPEDPPFVAEEGSFIYTSQYEGTFEIFITDECGEIVSVFVEVGTCVTEIPNIFTPNGDGDNEFFHIFGLEGFPGSRLVVYNRWGTIVYEDDNYSNNWNAQDVSDGVYYYVLTRSDDEQFSGSVTIKRN